MKYRVMLLILGGGILAGCSGVLPSLGAGPVVAPSYLDQYTGGGSMSTLWYLGSDARYHHFSHLFKTTTRYRVKREDLDWKPEFPLDTEKSVLVGSGVQAAKWRFEGVSRD